MRSELSESESNVFRNILDMSKSEIILNVGAKSAHFKNTGMYFENVCLQCFQAGLDAFRPFLVIFSAYDAPIGSEVV